MDWDLLSQHDQWLYTRATACKNCNAEPETPCSGTGHHLGRIHSAKLRFRKELLDAEEARTLSHTCIWCGKVCASLDGLALHEEACQ